jgi:mono/diheme cytochrome c family protein
MAGVMLLWTVSSSSAVPPFVAGFDRFVEHEEISREGGGRLLLTELSCTACHKTERDDLQPKGGPDLNGVGTRAGREWLERYLANPHKVKPGATMPDLLSGLKGQDKQQTVDALATFLSTLKQPYPEVKGSGAKPVPFQFWLKGNPQRGEKLYHTAGCVACHEPDPDYETAERKPTPLDQMLQQLDPEEIEKLGLARMARPLKSVPHGDLAGKYTPESLTFFLLDPAKSRPAGRMPDFQLTAVEAADIASYLISQHPNRNPESPPKPGSKVIAQGRTLFVDLGCVNCHAVKGLEPKLTAAPLAKLDFEQESRCSRPQQTELPQYHLNDMQQAALSSAVAGLSQDATLSRDALLDLTLLQLNCFGCHERNERGGVGRNRKPYFETVRHIDLGNEGRIPPPLTGVGRKLTKSWIKKVLDGTGTVRPYYTARMPKFPSQKVSSLPAQFVRADEFETKTESQVFGKLDGLAEAGRQLFDTGCVKCHPIRGEALPGVIGVDLHDATARMHPEWFREFLFDPGAIKPRTRMPTFFPNGVSSNQEILDGDVDRQIASLWAYLKEADKLPLPQQVLDFRAQNFELIPKDKPIILRTFMEEAGTHAIAVGFPEKVHFAYDAEQVRLAQIWKGRFLDAQSTWFERFVPPADPLGEHILNLPNSASLYLTDSDGGETNETRPEFRGYRLGKDGVPVFLSRLGPLDIEERIASTDQNSLLRTWSISVRKGEEFHQQLHCQPLSKTAKPTGAKTFVDDQGLKLNILEGITAFGISGAAKAFVQPEQPTKKHSVTLKLEYQW